MDFVVRPRLTVDVLFPAERGSVSGQPWKMPHAEARILVFAARLLSDSLSAFADVHRDYVTERSVSRTSGLTPSFDTPRIVLALLPPPRNVWNSEPDGEMSWSSADSIPDYLLSTTEIQHLLASPNDLVVFVSSDPMWMIDGTVLDWLVSTYPNHAAREIRARYAGITRNTPLKWAFLNIQKMRQLRQQSPEMRDYLIILVAMARGATLDPTGARSLFRQFARLAHSVVDELPGPREAGEDLDPQRVSYFEQLPPSHALVVDDEDEIALRHALFLRRLGFSVVVPMNSRELDSIRRCILDSGHVAFDAFALDLVIQFDVGTVYATDLLSSTQWNREPCVQMIISGKDNELGGLIREFQNSPRGTRLVRLSKPIVDVHQLVVRYTHECGKRDIGPLRGGLNRRAYPDVDTGNHPSRDVRLVVRRLDMLRKDFGRDYGQNYKSILLDWECYQMAAGVEGTIASAALRSLQETEVSITCEQAFALNRKPWQRRLDEIVARSDSTFDQDARFQPLWLRARLLTDVARLVGERSIEPSIGVEFEIEAYKARGATALARLRTSFDEDGGSNAVRMLTNQFANRLSRMLNSIRGRHEAQSHTAAEQLPDFVTDLLEDVAWLIVLLKRMPRYPAYALYGIFNCTYRLLLRGMSSVSTALAAWVGGFIVSWLLYAIFGIRPFSWKSVGAGLVMALASGIASGPIELKVGGLNTPFTVTLAVVHSCYSIVVFGVLVHHLMSRFVR